MSDTLASDPKTTSVLCPKCNRPLVDPYSLGWCKRCGYCRSLAESEPKVETPTAAPTTLTATGSAIGQMPIWFWVTLFGVALIAGATFACGRFLTLSPFERALLATLQIVAGVAIMFVGQIAALMKIAPEDSTLSFKDALFPFRLYGLVAKRLPATQHCVYLGVWGMSLILCASIFVGGLGHWLNYIPKSKTAPNAVQKPKS